MDKHALPGIGMRKIKSLLAVSLSFVIWQVVRIWLPQLEVHPLFGYVYSIIEMRDSAEKTKIQQTPHQGHSAGACHGFECPAHQRALRGLCR